MAIKSIPGPRPTQLPVDLGASVVDSGVQTKTSTSQVGAAAQNQQNAFQTGAGDAAVQQSASMTSAFAQNGGLRSTPAQSSLSLQIAQGMGQVALQPDVAVSQTAATTGPSAVQARSTAQAQQVSEVAGPTEAQTKEQVIEAFYDAMKAKDFDKIMSLYHPDAVFSDPAFPNISGKKLQGMWKLITGNKSLEVSTRDVKAQPDGSVTGHWDADYELIKGNPIFNQIDSKFEFKDGKIIKHTDSFDFAKWSDQAFPGILGKAIGTKFGHFVMSKIILPFAI